jgi:hypothetical protein
MIAVRTGKKGERLPDAESQIGVAVKQPLRPCTPAYLSGIAGCHRRRSVSCS